MPRMIDVIRNSALPSNTMQFAAKGALLVPAQEMIEILVYLAKHNKVFGEQARMTLAGWDENSSCAAAANPETPKEVLDYLVDPENLRPALLPVLLENPSVGEELLNTLATSATREQVEAFLKSARVSRSENLLNVLLSNPCLKEVEARSVKEKLAALQPQQVSQNTEVPSAKPETAVGEGAPPASQEDDLSDEAIAAFLREHAAEITGEEVAFEPVSEVYEEQAPVASQAPVGASSESTPVSHGGSAAAAAKRKAVSRKWILSADEQRGSALQKIAKLDVKGRILLAIKGTKEERSLLIRDGTKIVALAVLESPKVTDAEVEGFASQKNVLDSVLRAIPMKRRFMKQYPIVRNLTFNPRTPIDVALGLIKNLLVHDLRNLAGNKEVSDTVRKLATKMFRQKLDVTKRS